MELIKLLRDLNEKNIHIEVVDNELDIIVKEDNLSNELLNRIKNNKELFLEHFKNKGKTGVPSKFTFSGLKLKEFKKLLVDNNIDEYEIEDIYNLTPLQESFLFLSNINRESSTYFEQITLDIEGEVNIPLFEKGWKQIVQRHNALRTMFISDFRIPLQIVLKERNFDFSFIEIEKGTEIEKSLDRIKTEDRCNYFNLEMDPLFRIKLIWREKLKYSIIISFHHIILDGWSLPVILSEFIDYYTKLVKNENIFPNPAPEYSNYISWLNNREINLDRNYWSTYLKGYSQLATIPKDRITCSKEKEEQLNYTFSIKKELTDSIIIQAEEMGVTLNTIVHTVWGVILSRYNGTEDIVFGSTVSGRPHGIMDIEKMVGLFINTIPVRIKAEGDKSFNKVAQEVQRNSLKSIPYHYSSLAEIQSGHKLNNGLLDHILVFENYPVDEVLKGKRSPLFKIKDIDAREQINYDIGITVFPTDNLTFRFVYNPEIYREKRIRIIESHIRKTFTEIMSNKDILIGDIDIIPEDEKNLLLNIYNNTTVGYPKGKTIIQLFEEQVKRIPDNIAVVFEDIELTFKELNEKANIVAHYLRDNYKIKSNDLIGVLLERSEKMVIALLGILKSGAAYVPIDPEYPVDRIRYMLEDSKPKIVLSECDKDSFIDINRILEKSSNFENPERINSLKDLAYVIYTSGSTGKPKGVMIREQSIVNFLYGFNEKLDNKISCLDNCASIVNNSFDVSVCELFISLIFGAKLYIYKNSVFDLDDYCTFLEDKKITFGYIHPGILDDVADNHNKEKLYLEKILVGVEGIKDTTLNKFLDLNNNMEIINGYGPTEDTICATFFKYSSKTYTGENIPIGKPLSNTRIYILDDRQKLLPHGVIGELYISGIGLAKGYLNRPDLTKEKFIGNPFMTGEIMYGSGDLARWLPDGNIKFYGRSDNQVKIRGFRIEMEEIETVLLLDKNISSVVVLASKGNDGNQYLSAFYVSETKMEISGIRDHLKRILPDYMIPSFFIQMDSLPYTPNGKIDRKALPKPNATLKNRSNYIAPRNKTEKDLVNIWCDILEIDKIGIHDNFFELGGHSLRATKVVYRTGRELEVTITLNDIFENPTIYTLSKYINQSGRQGFDHIRAIKKQESYELSNAQKRLWILDQFEENSITYNMPKAFYLTGTFNEKAFRNSYAYIVGRHESLRTVFISEKGEPRQKILDNPDFNIDVIDLREYANKETIVEKYSQQDISTPFDLKNGPLVRIRILRVEIDKYILLFNMHHIISDGWSIEIFVREFLTSYNSYRNGDVPALKPLRIHYKDYSAWKNNLLNSKEMNRQKDYWLNKLSGGIPVLDIPSDKFRPIVQTFNGMSRSFFLSKETNSSLNDLCRKCNVSLFMILQGLVKVLFHKYTGENEIIIGSPVAGRVHGDLEHQIGFYVNTLALKDNISDNTSFMDLMGDVRKTCTEAFDNQDYPFDRLVENLDLKRDLSRSPIFDILLVLQNNESTSIKFDGLEYSPYISKNVVSKFDMTFYFTETDKVLNCEIEFNTDIYTVDRIKRMIDHLKTLLSSILENPESKIMDLEILPEKEKNLLLDRFNNTKTDFSLKKNIINLFEEQAERIPDEIAIVFNDVALTYRGLNEQANIVAHYLKDKYIIKPDNLVGILMERSVKMVISLLGVLKSGAAFVPIDPDYPEKRIDYIVEDSRPVTVLGESDGAFTDNISMVDINRILESETGIENPDNNTTSENLVYAIYTSGSTGKPKGVLLEQKTLINLVDFETNQTNLEFTNKKVLQFAALSFDVCYQEIFSTILNGGTLYLIGNKIKKDPNLLLNNIGENGINVVFLPTAYLKFISRETEYLHLFPPTLEHIIAAGEQLIITDDLIYELKQKRIFLHNHYGPSETHVVTTLTLDFNKNMKMVPTIGGPISNTTIHIIDKNNRITPIGTPGELCVSGIALAREYLNNPELTISKFVDNPYNPGEKMYRTGDLARWLPCGNIEFLGRIDNQVKIRGFRIELDEIESSILKHGKINSAVVLAKKGTDGENQLVSYFLSDSELVVSELRDYLGKTLPDFMIPSYFIPMKTFPLTPNGKVDLKKLPEPDIKFSTGIEYIAPRNTIEEKLTEIWKDILRIEKIGVHDNFFELGGHSLKATRVVSRICKEIGANITLKDIFEQPTIEFLSGVIKDAERKEYSSIIPIEKQDSYKVSNAQKRLWVLDQIEEDSVVYNIPVAFYMEGEFDRDAFQKAHSYIIERHESLRTVFITEDGEPRQKILKKIDSVLKILDIRDEPKNRAEELVENEFLTPFNLEKGPLIRFTLLRVKNDVYLVLFNMHHIISDGWSMNILTREFIKAYNSFRINSYPDLPVLKIQYKDYSAWKNALMDSSAMDNQREYWLEKLGGELPVQDLPADRIRPSIQSFNGINLSFTLPKKVTSSLNKICLGNNVSLFITLQAIVKILIYRYTSQSDIIIGSPLAGRIHGDLENQIGFFVNTLAFRDSVIDDLRFDEFLGEVKKTCVEAFENQDFPFDKLVEELNVERDLSRPPIFDVMLVLQNNETTEIEFNGLKVSTYDAKNHVSKFDMTFSFTETKNSLICGIEYNTAIYNKDRIDRMACHIKTLISSVISNPEIQIRDIEIIPEEEKNLLLNVFNDTKEDFPLEKTIFGLFEEQVEKTPDNIAVVFEDVEMTYRELNRKANIVGHYLRGNYGIKPDDFVGVLLKRSEKMIIAILGILKAGAAYIPIDPEYPEERINYILEDSKPKTVLSDRNDNPLIDINEILETGGINRNQERTSDPDNLAYIIYTSGSTGKPKGTLLEHKSLINLCMWHIKRFELTSNDIISQYASIGFDASVWEIFPSLISGSSLHVINNENRTDLGKLSLYFRSNHITAAFLPTPIYEQFKNEQCTDLRLILSGGAKLESYKKNCYKLYNNYGPTENAVVTTSFHVENQSNNIPIGKPISNTSIYILDKNNCLNPIGISGELCISGEGLARGYLNRPNLTSEKFIDNPLVSGKRMYRTGDLARWRTDGNIEFLGRKDNQIKIRGFRIEPGEIENTLLQHNDIKATTIVPYNIQNGEKKLIAYYSCEKELEIPELKYFLKKSLPDYMIPSLFIHMINLPLTPNGKVDRRALPEPCGSITGRGEYVAPRNGTEEKLVEIWQEELGMERIGIDDNFFELGANSISAIKVTSKAAAMEIKLKVQDLYSFKTIKEIAINLKSHIGLSESRKLERIENNVSMKIPNIFNKEEPGNVLLLGATGFLGIHLLRELLITTSSKIICIVRGENNQTALDRLQAKLASYFPDKQFNSLFGKRFEVIAGDISKKHFALPENTYKYIEKRIDRVINSAALVKHIGDYNTFYQANVESVRNLIQFSKTGNKTFTHISTISLIQNMPLLEGYDSYNEEHLFDCDSLEENVYLQSKLEAERLIIESKKKGLKAIVCRVGNLTGRRSDGIFQSNIEENSFYGLLKSLVQMGCVPDSSDQIDFEFSPVDDTSEAIIKATFTKESENRVFHIYNHLKTTLNEIVEVIKETYNINSIPFDDFKALLIKEGSQGNVAIQKFIIEMGLKTDHIAEISNQFTSRYLEENGFKWDKVDNGYIERIFNHMNERSFI